MKKLTQFVAIIALATVAATGAMAGEKIQPLKVAKSTQAAPPTSLGVGGLGAGATGAIIAGLIVTTIVVLANSTTTTTTGT